MGHAAAPILIVSGPSGAGKSTVSRLVAAAFEPSAVVEADAFMGFIASGWIEPNLPEAGEQKRHRRLVAGRRSHRVRQRRLHHGGRRAPVPPAVLQIARAGQRRGVPVHYAVLRADNSTCWGRARDRPAGRWPLERESFDALHVRFAGLDLPERHAVDASGPVGEVAARVHAALQAGTLAAAPG